MLLYCYHLYNTYAKLFVDQLSWYTRRLAVIAHRSVVTRRAAAEVSVCGYDDGLERRVDGTAAPRRSHCTTVYGASSRLRRRSRRRQDGLRRQYVASAEDRPTGSDILRPRWSPVRRL